MADKVPCPFCVSYSARKDNLRGHIKAHHEPDTVETVATYKQGVTIHKNADKYYGMCWNCTTVLVPSAKSQTLETARTACRNHNCKVRVPVVDPEVQAAAVSEAPPATHGFQDSCKEVYDWLMAGLAADSSDARRLKSLLEEGETVEYALQQAIRMNPSNIPEFVEADERARTAVREKEYFRSIAESAEQQYMIEVQAHQQTKRRMEEKMAYMVQQISALEAQITKKKMHLGFEI